MYLSEFLPFLRVRYPSVGTPHGVTGLRPGVVEPSPPPCGWSTGFIAVPRVCGRAPMCRLRPALPTFTFWCSALPSVPTVARQLARTSRISPDGRRSVAMSPSLAISCTEAPAGRHAHPHAEALGGEDVALLGVAIVQQGDIGGAVGVVFDRRDLCLDPIL